MLATVANHARVCELDAKGRREQTSRVAKTRRELLEVELTRLEAEALILDRDFRRVPLLMLFALSAIPAYSIWGPTAAIYAVLAAPCLVITALYLVGVRRAENKQMREEIANQLGTKEQEPG